MTSGSPTGLAGNALLVTDHGLLLSGLSAGTEYFFTVISQDGIGNQGESVEAAFTTASSGNEDDGDGDGVGDEDDRCPDTSAGDVVNERGCSIANLCPCEGPAFCGEHWKNHGKYVACVKRVSRKFFRQGLITRHERAEIIRDAARSDCGKRH